MRMAPLGSQCVTTWGDNGAKMFGIWRDDDDVFRVSPNGATRLPLVDFYTDHYEGMIYPVNIVQASVCAGSEMEGGRIGGAGRLE